MRMATQDFRLNRLFSAPLTAVFLKTPITPNQVTLLSIASGLAAAFCFSRGAYAAGILGALFYQTACVLDNCDGEVARAKSLGSPFGAWFDIAADFVTDAALFTGLALGAAQGDSARFAGTALILCLSGASLHLALVVAEKLRGFGPAAFNAPNPDRAGRKSFWYLLFDALREGEASWLVLVFALLGGADWLLWFGAFYMQALWITALWLNGKHLRRHS